MLRSMVVMAMMASPIQNRLKKPWKSRCSEAGSKCDTREANSMVGKMRRLCSARTCFLADESTCCDGGASGGTGVERPLFYVIITVRILVGACSCSGGCERVSPVPRHAALGRLQVAGRRRRRIADVRELRVDGLARPRPQHVLVEVVGERLVQGCHREGPPVTMCSWIGTAFGSD